MSLSGGVADETAEAFADALDARGVPLTHLLRPARRARRAGRVDPRARAAVTRSPCTATTTPRARSATAARKGEFACLPRHEAGLRLTAARRALTAAGRCGPTCSCRRAGWPPTARSPR